MSNPTTDSGRADDLCAVTDADRDAAADLIETYWSGAVSRMRPRAGPLRKGHPQGAFPRAFARHRLNATTDQSAEIARLRAALEKARNWLDYKASPMGTAETRMYERLMSEIDTALNTKDADR